MPLAEPNFTDDLRDRLHEIDLLATRDPEEPQPRPHVYVPERLRALNIAPPSWNWQDGQRELVESIVNSPKKVVIVQAEPGWGKSVIGLAAIASDRVDADGIVLLQNRDLQQQYARDFRGVAVMDGRRHSICPITHESSDTAPCTVGVKCERSGHRNTETGVYDVWPTCEYFEKKAIAASSRYAVLNYPYWLSEGTHVGIFSRRKWIICDEAHRTTGVTLAEEDESAFTKVHDNKFLKAEHRMYMTATFLMLKQLTSYSAML